MLDEQIVTLYLQRDEAAIKETANKYQNYCYRIAFDILHSDPHAAPGIRRGAAEHGDKSSDRFGEQRRDGRDQNGGCFRHLLHYAAV